MNVNVWYIELNNIWRRLYMKRTVAGALVLILLFCTLVGCSTKKLLTEEDFNVYKDRDL